jgi:hypothetical protein
MFYHFRIWSSVYNKGCQKISCSVCHAVVVMNKFVKNRNVKLCKRFQKEKIRVSEGFTPGT